MNNPDLLADTTQTLDMASEASPSNSPAAKNTKTDAPSLTSHQNAPAPRVSQKKRSNKRDNSSAVTSVLHTGRYSTGPSPITDKPNPPQEHIYCYKKILIELSIDFQRDCFAQFDGDNGKKMVFAIQQLILKLRIADKMACLHSSEDSPEDPL